MGSKIETKQYNPERFMKIRPGHVVDNKSRAYLLKSMNLLDTDFMKRLNRVACLGVGIGDHRYSLDEDNKLYVLIDNNGYIWNKPILHYCNPIEAKENLIKFIEYLEDKEYFHNFYSFATNNDYTMLVLNLPEELNDIKSKFCAGEYSKMYTKSQLDICFPKVITDSDGKERENPVYKVLAKDKSYAAVFANKLKRELNLDKVPDFDAFIEYDFRPTPKQEIFNFIK